MKKFSNYYINYHNILKNSIIGFEFEFYTSKSYYKLLEVLNRELEPIKVWGQRKYHSDFKPDDKNFKIEPDLSGGNDMIELITGPMNYTDSKIILLKILNIIQNNAYTDEKCSIHINVSFDKDKVDSTLDKLNPLKLILDIDEDYILNMFPNRKNNFYAKSVKKIIPFKNYEYSSNAIDHIQSNIELPNTKYYGVNIKNYTEGRLEYRYIGGTDYHYKTREILELMDYFILLTWNCIDKELDDDDVEKLLDYLSDNIANFKKFNDLENFIGEFPSIRLEVDKNNEFFIIKSYYNKMYDRLYDLLNNTFNLNDATVNYDTETNKIEVVDAFIKGIFDLKYLNFIDCRIFEGTYYKSEFDECDIKNSHIESCKIINSDVFNCKLTNCEVNSDCVLDKVYFYGGFMNGEMKSGIFRGGVIGPDAIIGDGVKLITDDDNYFGTSIKNGVDKKSQKDIKLIKK
ncbi:hypothetical protein [Trichloromonas sp.]|uniref:hypothetical protein n=1 Tax=Trichloromonas sp. TaxID=3069249 RepID=UPI002A477439|nr:hypothetical protein [Trichloromonas sp.]